MSCCDAGLLTLLQLSYFPINSLYLLIYVNIVSEDITTLRQILIKESESKTKHPFPCKHIFNEFVWKWDMKGISPSSWSTSGFAVFWVPCLSIMWTCKVLNEHPWCRERNWINMRCLVDWYCSLNQRRRQFRNQLSLLSSVQILRFSKMCASE